MKIVIFGATGDVGQHIVGEAISRQHQVIAIGRSTAKLATLPESVTPIRADLTGNLESLAEQLSGCDLAISALRPDEGRESMMLDLTRNALAAAKEAGTPIIITGGAALLKLNDGSGHTVLSAPHFLPNAVRPIAEACAAQDALLEATSNVEWTCLRPPAMLLEKPLNRQFRFGTDTLITDSAGVSQISYCDFAAAMLDVAENRTAFSQRLTVAWASAPEPQGSVWDTAVSGER